MSTIYTINEQGQRYVSAFVRENGKDDLNVEAFFNDADSAANDAFDREMAATIEIGRQMAYDGRPHVLTLDQAWFDACEANDE